MVPVKISESSIFVVLSDSFEQLVAQTQSVPLTVTFISTHANCSGKKGGLWPCAQTNGLHVSLLPQT